MSTAEERPVSAEEADALLADLAGAPALVLAVSGGPDSTAMLVLVAQWRRRLERGPDLLAVTVDHGLRPESKREAAAVKRFAAEIGIPHRTLRWSGKKPTTGLQEKARAARYDLLASAARRTGARHVLTAHTRDDQAETVLLRLARGSGLTGLGGMARLVALGEISLVRPFLDIPKARLVATLRAAGVTFAQDPSNHDPRFTRARLRRVMPILAGEGLDAGRLSLLARRLRRADAAIDAAVEDAARRVTSVPWPHTGPVEFDAGAFAVLPTEVALRMLGRAIARVGDEGPVELGKLETLFDGLRAALGSGSAAGGAARFRRTLAGAVVTLGGERMTVERAPPRRIRADSGKSAMRSSRKPARDPFTTRG
ncbi:MAG TPA: tRNA lysidine(34) synthetase TilS [Xanthobacteraceae bacterium]|nr:tRNA lysidine(34) synthetase TilS [Xanthobacteraceae bacterium]